MEFNEIKNTSQREFKDISSEDYRRYKYPGYVGRIEEDGITELVNTINVLIDSPIGLSVSKSGHYIIDVRGVTHFMPYGFVELAWKSKENNPNIVC